MVMLKKCLPCPFSPPSTKHTHSVYCEVMWSFCQLSSCCSPGALSPHAYLSSLNSAASGGPVLTFRELNFRTSHYCPAARPSRPCPSSLVYLDSAPPNWENCKNQKNGLLPRMLNQIFKMKNISFGSSYVKKEGAGGEESRFSSVHLFYTMMVF